VSFLFVISLIAAFAAGPQKSDAATTAPDSLISVDQIQAAALSCNAKIAVEQYNLEEYESEGAAPSIMISIFNDNSTEAIKCLRQYVPNVMSIPVKRRSDAKLITSDNISNLQKICKWSPSDGKIELYDDGTLSFEPDPNIDYEKVDCALHEISKFHTPKFGFVGNEHYQADENGDPVQESDGAK